MEFIGVLNKSHIIFHEDSLSTDGITQLTKYCCSEMNITFIFIKCLLD